MDDVEDELLGLNFTKRVRLGSLNAIRRKWFLPYLVEESVSSSLLIRKTRTRVMINVEADRSAFSPESLDGLHGLLLVRHGNTDDDQQGQLLWLNSVVLGKYPLSWHSFLFLPGPNQRELDVQFQQGRITSNIVQLDLHTRTSLRFCFLNPEGPERQEEEQHVSASGLSLES